MSDLDRVKRTTLNQLGVDLCEGHISYIVRNDTHHMGEMAIENYLENYDDEAEYTDGRTGEVVKLTEADKEYLKNNSLKFMDAAMVNLNI